MNGKRKDYPLTHTNKTFSKTIFFFTSLLIITLILSQELLSATAKHSNHLQPGDEILTHITKADGRTPMLPESFKGKTILMVFAAAEQKFSQKALKDVQAIVEEAKITAFEAIGIVSASQGPQEVQQLIEVQQLNYPLIYDKQDIAAQLRILVYPTTIIIDRQGRLAYHYALYSPDYQEVISSQLKKIIEDKTGSYINGVIAKRQHNEEIQKARKAIEKDDIKSAIAILSSLPQKGSESYNIHLLLGYSYISLSKPEKAVSHFKKAKDIEPESTSAELGMGIAYSRAGEKNKAIPLLKKIADNDPDSSFAYRELSLIFEQQNDLDKAIYYIKNEIESLTRQFKD
jgi:tetratricopeptide (TPR) repeat protein